ncbi:MAG: hypothetical protein FE834_02690 [Gammaproteobacteria bacterium]|nr:hypothetical protein [Gammaproteobacteria bacterium]
MQRTFLKSKLHRLTTTIRGKENSGVILVNGVAPHKVAGDLLIIAAYSSYSEDELRNYQPALCYVDEKNVLTKISQ